MQENREKALYGVTLEPLELALLTGQETLTLERSILGYQVHPPSPRHTISLSRSVCPSEGLSWRDYLVFR